MKYLLLLTAVFALGSGSAYGTEKQHSNTCSKNNLKEFTNSYRKLQEDIKTTGDGKNIIGNDLKNKLYENYSNALVKVSRIYNHISGDAKKTDAEDKLKSDPVIANFIKLIQNEPTDKKVNNLNIEVLLDRLKTVSVNNEKLNEVDIYLLRNLLIHSQDRTCTLAKYITPRKKQKNTPYLEQLKGGPLYKLIDSLKLMKGSENLQHADQEKTLGTVVDADLLELRKIVLKMRDCAANLKKNKIKGDTDIQSCNFEKLIDSLLLPDSTYNNFAAILNFINANHQAQTHTDIEWENLVQKGKDQKPVCSKSGDSFYAKNLTTKNDKLDPEMFDCGDKKKGKDCYDLLDFKFIDGIGFKISLKKTNLDLTLTINNEDSCKVNFPLTKEKPPVIPAEIKVAKLKCEENKEKKSVTISGLTDNIDAKLFNCNIPASAVITGEDCKKHFDIKDDTITKKENKEEGLIIEYLSIGNDKESSCSKLFPIEVKTPTDPKKAEDNKPVKDDKAQQACEAQNHLANGDVIFFTNPDYNHWDEKTNACITKKPSTPTNDSPPEDKKPTEPAQKQEMPAQYIPPYIPQNDVIFLQGGK
jgi:hypothetical protein